MRDTAGAVRGSAASAASSAPDIRDVYCSSMLVDSERMVSVDVPAILRWFSFCYIHRWKWKYTGKLHYLEKV